MTSDRIVDPFILCNAVCAERCLTMLREEICLVIIILENIEDLIFIHDGVPPYFAIVVHHWLNAHYSGRWTGRRGQPEVLT